MPLDRFASEEACYDAADFKDCAVQFLRAMRLARTAIAKTKGQF